jgi:hypothetical protein
MIDTICNKCIFAVTENGEQTGCKLGRLEKFKELGVAEKEDSGFYRIKRLCIACRDSTKYENPEEEILKEIAPRTTAILDCRESDFDINYFEFLVKQGIYQILVVFKNQKISDYNNRMSEIINGTNVRYRIVKFLEDQPIETVYKYINGNYILIGSLADGMIEEFNNSIVNDLKQYVLFGRKDSYIVSSSLFKYRSQNIEEILEYLKTKENFEEYLCVK